MNPVSAIFGAGVALRNALYDRGVFKVRKLARPVVSIGNISVGGSGKTPFVIALGELLQQRGIEFDVLSRGYGRRSTAIAVVDPDGTAEQFGDEPLLIARKLRAPVIVGADRYQAGLLAEKQFPSKLHLLDDGFQHRRLHRDFDIVLLPAEDQRGTLLPTGRLREPLSALRRADAVVLPDPAEKPPHAKSVWRVRRQIEIAADGRAIAFCGIARPQQFFDALKAAHQEIAGTLTFRDHHRYAQRDIHRLLDLKKLTGATDFVTTEKDAMNLGALSAHLQSLRTATLRIDLESPDSIIAELFKALEQRSGCRL
ncbi:MAG TPA: tetraacyldisaccharide 4'-kinase [Candidatus Angelobacter sp.]|jgi:tetraacyldisaccharide 4'-kinase|nr:tetraacyldisaccharide 4'-kinase [Candidatus Angelobacter sp.]